MNDTKFDPVTDLLRLEIADRLSVDLLEVVWGIGEDLGDAFVGAHFQVSTGTGVGEFEFERD